MSFNQGEQQIKQKHLRVDYNQSEHFLKRYTVRNCILVWVR